MENTFRIPADVAAHCIKAAFVLASSEKMMRDHHEIMRDETDPDWYVSLPNAAALTCADNLKAAHEFLHWLGQFAEDDPQPELDKLDAAGTPEPATAGGCGHSQQRTQYAATSDQ